MGLYLITRQRAFILRLNEMQQVLTVFVTKTNEHRKHTNLLLYCHNTLCEFACILWNLSLDNIATFIYNACILMKGTEQYVQLA